MATKLKNLHVKKVDFVDEGANPKAFIKLFKRNTSQIEEPTIEESLINPIVKKLTAALSGKGKKESIVKNEEATSFKTKMNEVSSRKIQDEIWEVCYALQSSLCSIVLDEEITEQQQSLELMQQSIQEFVAAINEYIDIWSAGGAVNIRKSMAVANESEFSILCATHENLGKLIQKAKEKKGDIEEVIEIDKSKMSTEERAIYDTIIEKYAAESAESEIKKKTINLKNNEDFEEDIEDEEASKKKKDCKKSITPFDANEPEDIYKGLHPTVRAEIESLKKYRENAEIKELTDIAKKYEIIGKKPEELVPTLKSLREAGGTAYDDMIGILDATLNTVQQSGVFGEIGKSRGKIDSSGEEAVAKVKMMVSEIKKSRPEMTTAQAMDEVLLNNPELREKFDK